MYLVQCLRHGPDESFVGGDAGGEGRGGEGRGGWWSWRCFHRDHQLLLWLGEQDSVKASVSSWTLYFISLIYCIRPGYRTESPGEEVHEVRLHRQLSGQFLIWCKSTVNFHNKFGTRRDILEFKSLFQVISVHAKNVSKLIFENCLKQVHGKMRSKIPPYGPFAKTLHGWALPMSVLPLPLQEKLGATVRHLFGAAFNWLFQLWRSSIHNSLLQFIQRQQEDVGGPSDSFSLRLSETVLDTCASILFMHRLLLRMQSLQKWPCLATPTLTTSFWAVLRQENWKWSLQQGKSTDRIFPHWF